MPYITRSLERVLRRAAGEFPAVVLTGPRQSGKTTLLRHLFGKKHAYVSLDRLDLRTAAQTEPEAFIRRFPPPVILDEIQYAPNLLPYLKDWIDGHRSLKGQFLLTGSQNFLLARDIGESLAGRVAVLKLWPLSWGEMDADPGEGLPWETARRRKAHGSKRRKGIWERILRGGYPELHVERKRPHDLWHLSYLQTYIERDLRQIRQIGDLTQFQAFLRTLAARSGQLFNMTAVSRDLGVAVNTVKAWLSILEASHQILILRPYHTNAGKRLVKTPKIYFADTGTLCNLTGIRDVQAAESGPLGGVLVETAIVNEMHKRISNRGEEPVMYFWRTSDGREVDLVVEMGGRLFPVEVKLSSSMNPAMAGGIETFQKDYAKTADRGFLVGFNDKRLPLTRNVESRPIWEF